MDIEELMAQIPEWHCKTCNTIHLPPDGCNLCCPTPKCTGLLKPSSQAIRIVEDQRDELLDTLKLAGQHLWEINDSLLILKRIDKVIDRVENNNA